MEAFARTQNAAVDSRLINNYQLHIEISISKQNRKKVAIYSLR